MDVFAKIAKAIAWQFLDQKQFKRKLKERRKIRRSKIADDGQTTSSKPFRKPRSSSEESQPVESTRTWLEKPQHALVARELERKNLNFWQTGEGQLVELVQQSPDVAGGLGDSAAATVCALGPPLLQAPHDKSRGSAVDGVLSETLRSLSNGQLPGTFPPSVDVVLVRVVRSLLELPAAVMLQQPLLSGISG